MPIIPRPAHIEVAAPTPFSGSLLDLVEWPLEGPEAYRLTVTHEGASVEAETPAGHFYAQQTLAQLDQHWRGTITDHARFAYRGAMLDIVRHFFDVPTIKAYIDHIAALKFNHLHLHLTDDQGWRLHIDSWPLLTERGATTQVGGGGGGFLTQDDYRNLVAYAAERFVTIVPEIDIPGHTNAAIVAYPRLGDAPAEPYEGIEVGFSSLAIRSDETYAFVEDVVREVAEITPGPYLHLGGDESLATTDEDFLYFIGRATEIAARYGKTLIGWHEMGRSRELPAGTIGQYWSFLEPQPGAAEHTLSFVEQGGTVIMSPGDVAYLDMKHTDDDEHGLVWANGPTTLRDAYSWDPAAIVPGVGEEQILGIEAPIWTETVTNLDELEYMVFPRIAALAEIAWSPAATNDFDEFSGRLERFVAALDVRGIRHH